MTTVDAVINKQDNGLEFLGWSNHQNQFWKGSLDCVAFEPGAIKEKLLTTDKPCYIIRVAGKIGVTHDGYLTHVENPGQGEFLISIPPIRLQQFGDPKFLADYGVKYAYLLEQWLGELLLKKWSSL